MKVADNLEYTTVVPNALTWEQCREGVNRMKLMNYKPFPDGYFRLYLDFQGIHDLLHDPYFKPTKSYDIGVFGLEGVLIVLYENSFLMDPYIGSYLLVTRSSSAELVGFRSRSEPPF
jgi:hypothetical protein